MAYQAVMPGVAARAVRARNRVMVSASVKPARWWPVRLPCPFGTIGRDVRGCCAAIAWGCGANVGGMGGDVWGCGRGG